MAALGATSSAVWLRGPVDGLGRRAIRWTGEGEAVEVLRLADHLSAAPACASQLADVAFALEALQHHGLRPAPTLEELADGTPVLVSRYVAGERLADLLSRTTAAGTPLTTSASLFILRELVDAVRALHGAGLSHGAIAPERVLVTPDHRVVLLDHALGATLAAVGATAADLWADHAIAVPVAAGLPAFSPLTDQLQLGLMGLAMFLGRSLGPGEYPGEVAHLLASAQETDLTGRQSPLGPMLREWLARTTLVSANGPFPSVEAAAGDLDILLSDDGGYVAAPLGIDVQPADPEPLSAAEVASLGLLLRPDQREEGGEPVPAETATVESQASHAAEGHASATPASAGGAVDAAGPHAQAGGGHHTLHLVPAPDPTQNSERILELAHGLDGSRKLSVVPGGNPPGGAGPGEQAPRRRWRAWSSRAVVAAAGAVILLMAGVAAGAYYVKSGGTRAARLVIESSPPGARVVLEGNTLGRTPVEVSLPRGGHVFEIQGQHSSQSLSVVVGGGERRTEHVTLPEAGAPGTLVITTEPVGTPVKVDGVLRGSAPLSVQVAPGRHVVAASNEFGQASREIDVQTGAWVKVPLAVSGWIEVSSAVPVRTTVSGRPVRDGETRVGVAPGLHRVQFENSDIGLRDSQDVVVEAGRTVQVTVTGTAGVLEITASAANTTVWIDGKPAGRAPLTVSLALGPHDIRFVHAEGGELRYDVFVKMGSSYLHGDFGAATRPAPGRSTASRR
jgi:hypothetical protein